MQYKRPGSTNELHCDGTFVFERCDCQFRDDDANHVNGYRLEVPFQILSQKQIQPRDTDPPPPEL